ncbi:MAG: hypothetical protein LBL92_02675 [Propionibacteriaceae bacterium]|jgi:hypothetical protein|nr:hypothetical protein [Propionibacteriaceae bacterium]
MFARVHDRSNHRPLLPRRKRAAAVAAVFGLVALVGGMTISQPSVAAPFDVVSNFELVAEGPTTQLAGNTFTVRWKLIANGADDERLTAPAVQVTVPWQYVANVRPSAITSETVPPTVARTNEAHVITYQLSDVTAGRTLDIPIVMETDSYAPDQAVIPVTAVVTDSDGSVLEANHGQPLYLTVEAGDPVISMCIINQTGKCQQDKGDDSFPQAYAGISDDGGAHLSADAGRLSTVEVHFYRDDFESISGSWTPSWSGRQFSQVTLRYDLPTGAVFDSTQNPDWTLLPGGTAIERTFVPYFGDRSTSTQMSGLIDDATIRLLFPGAATGQTLTHQVTWTGIPWQPLPGEKAYVAQAQARFQLTSAWEDITFSTKFTFNPTVVNHELERSEMVGFDVTVLNPATDTTSSFTWVDHSALSTSRPAVPDPPLFNIPEANHGLDSRLYFSAIDFLPGSMVLDSWAGPLEVWVCRNNQPATLLTTITDLSSAGQLGSDLTSDYRLELSDGRDITCLEVRTASKTELPPGHKSGWRVETKFRDPVLDPLADGQSGLLWNTSWATATWADGRARANNVTASAANLSPYSPQVTLLKTDGDIQEDDDPRQVVSGYTVGWILNFYFSHAVDGLTVFKDLTVIDLLPTGLIYAGSSSESSGLVVPEPEIVNNYQNSGRQALIWRFGDVAKEAMDMSRLRIGVKTLVTPDAEEGLVENRGYVTVSNASDFSVFSQDLVVDEYDIDQDGDTSDEVLGDTASVNYLPPREAVARQQVKGGLDEQFLTAPQFGLTELDDGSVQFKLRFNNFLLTNIDHLTMVDALPRVGDQTLSPVAGVIQNRQSQFRVQLTGPLELPVDRADDFSVVYTTDAVGTRTAAELSRQARWTSAPADWSAVTAFQVKLKPGVVIAPNEALEFIVDGKVASTDPKLKGQSAFNSFATSVTADGSGFFESGRSEIRVKGPVAPEPQNPVVHETGVGASVPVPPAVTAVANPVLPGTGANPAVLPLIAAAAAFFLLSGGLLLIRSSEPG